MHTRGSSTRMGDGTGSSRRRVSGVVWRRLSSCAGAIARGAWHERGRSAVMWRRHHGEVPVAVIDVGSNTVRLVVARGDREIVSCREMLRLGASVERFGSNPADKLAQTAEAVRRFADAARAADARLVEILITSPGRQAANGEELLDVLSRAAGCHARVLSAVEEGRLAFAGAFTAESPPA